MIEFEVYPSDLRAHAGHVEQVSSDVKLAVDASQQASLTDGSLGLMVGPLITGALLIAETAARAALTSSGDAVDRLAQQVREMADDYEAADAEIGDTFQPGEMGTR